MKIWVLERGKGEREGKKEEQRRGKEGERVYT
jgi:hypothetical protein